MSYIKTFNFSERDADIVSFIEAQPNQSATAREAFRLLMQQGQEETGELALLREAVEGLRVEVRKLREAIAGMGKR